MSTRIAALVVMFGSIAAIAWVAFGHEQTLEQAANGPSSEDVSGPTKRNSTSNPASAEAGSAAGRLDPSQSGSGISAVDEPHPAPENLGPRMGLVEIDGWLNTSASSLDDFDGKVLLIEMWTFGCSNCKARIPYNQSYYQEFDHADFEIVGVHAPEFSYEAEVDNIKEAIERLGVTWPVALDTSKKNFRSWQPGSRNFWPRTYVVDQNGDIRYDHIGEGRYEELRQTIAYLVDNPPDPKP